MRRYCLLGLLLFLAFGPAEAKKTAPQVNVTGLQAEYQTNPAGIDYAPQLSWKLGSDAAGVVQSAYRILVASSLDNLENLPTGILMKRDIFKYNIL